MMRASLRSRVSAALCEDIGHRVRLFFASDTLRIAPNPVQSQRAPFLMRRFWGQHRAPRIGAGIQAALALWPDFGGFINNSDKGLRLAADQDRAAMSYGAAIADRWLTSRQGDGSSFPQSDTMYSAAVGHHRGDPVSGKQTLGITWGQVTPFTLSSVATPSGPPPGLTTQEYADAYDDVFVNGRDNIAQRKTAYRHPAAVGLFGGTMVPIS